VIVGVQAFVLSQLGLRLGAKISERLRDGAERAAGAALTGVGIALLVVKLSG
jgi:putative Mn2+ efflux pump MntP